MPRSRDDAIAELVSANHILDRLGVLDVFGHVSIRDPSADDRYLMARSLAPGLVTAADIVTFDLDSEPIGKETRPLYSERPIHGEIYKARPDVGSVCHSHSHSLIPFGVTPRRRLRPVLHMGALTGARVPDWDIRDEFGDTDMLVTDSARGESLARTLGDKPAALMRGHGAVVVGPQVREVVFAAYYMTVNADALAASLALRSDPIYLSDGEITLAAQMLRQPGNQNRAWEAWTHATEAPSQPD